VHGLLHARYLKGRRGKGKRKISSHELLQKKKNKKNEHSSIITVPTAVDIFLYAQDQAFN